MNARAAALACAVTLAAAACTRVGTATSGAAREHPWTEPGLLRIVDISEPDTLDPLVGNQQIDSDLAELWGSMLLQLDDRDRLVPDLASEVPTLANGGVSRGGLTIAYHLRRGVRWQDGAPFSAADVVFTWHAIMNPRNNIPSTVGYDDVARIATPDPFTLIVRLKRPYAPFVATFFGPSSTPYPVLPAHLLARYRDINRIPFNSQPVGTGPFIVEHWQRGSALVFRANPNYFRGPPKLREVRYTPVPDENTIVSLLAAHEADLEFHGSPNLIAQFHAIAGVRVLLTPFTQYDELALETRHPALADVRVRRALWYALDMPAMLRDTTHDVDVAAHTDQPSFSWAYDPGVPTYPYDPARARALLDAAGWKVGPAGIRVRDGKPLELDLVNVSGLALGNAIDVFVQDAWHAVGVDARIKNYPTALYFATAGAGGILQTGHFDAAGFGWVNGADPDDSANWMCDQIPPRGQNVSFYCNPALDRAERTALTHDDRATRKAAYAAIQLALARDVPAIFLWFIRDITVENTDLRGYRPTHAVSSFWNAYDWSI